MEYEHPRLVPRYSFVVDTELTDVQSGIQIKARTKDLCLFGCGVDTLKPLPKGANVRIKLSHGGTEVEALAKVIYARSDLGIGVAFTSLEREVEQILEGWIAELTSSSIQR